MDDRSTPPDRIAGPGASGRFDAYEGRRVADRYDLIRVAFDGANTTVFDALDTRTGRRAHVKLIAPELSASPSFRSQFDGTMRAVASFSHPNVAALYDWGVGSVGDASVAYTVVEPLTGGSLRDMFDRGRQLSPSQALAVGLDACKALDYAHRRGFVHTELTPSKLVFGDDRRLRIIDFGLARLLGEPLWQQPDSVASHVAWYSAPEQGLGQPIDGRTDVYALCLTLHEAVTGDLPFKSESTVAALAARVGRLMPVSADLGPLAAVIERAGRPERDERSTAAEFGQGLMRAASKLPRPEPLPLLSTGLFDVPVEQLRSPDDPTGGVNRPPTESADRGNEIIVVPMDEPGGDDQVVPDEPKAAAESAGPQAATMPPVATPPPASVEPAAPAPAEPPAPATPAAPAGPAEPDPPSARLEGPVIVEAAPDLDLGEQQVSDGGDLVILPLDSDIDREPATAPAQPAGSVAIAATATATAVTDAADEVVAEADASDTAVATAVMEPTPAPTAAMPATEPAPVDPPRRSRWSWIWKVLAGLVLIAAAVVGTIAAVGLFETPTYEVPDLVGVPLDDAQAAIEPNSWVVSIENERSDEVPEPGDVVRTSPAAGIELAEGEPFLLVVSDGPILREVPDSTGALFSEAQTRLLERGFSVDFVERFDEDVPEGTVIAWSAPSEPALVAGAMVEPGLEVVLTVSLGPEPRTVPGLVGRQLADAQAELGELRLVISPSGDVFNDEFPAGAVISQSPEAGTTVDRDTNVVVVVSRGPQVVPFPDLSAAPDFLAAAEILVRAGFDPRLVLGDAEAKVQRVRIDGAEPEVDQLFRKGTVVEIIAFDDI